MKLALATLAVLTVSILHAADDASVRSYEQLLATLQQGAQLQRTAAERRQQQLEDMEYQLHQIILQRLANSPSYNCSEPVQVQVEIIRPLY